MTRTPTALQVAIHEAGHAVAEITLFGPTVKSVTIQRLPGQYGSVDGLGVVWTNQDIDGRRIPSDELRKRIIVSLAGPLAEQRAIKASHAKIYRNHRFGDYSDALCLLRYIPRLKLTTMERQTRGLLRRRWRTILAVADALMARTTLTGDDVAALMP